MGFGGCARVQRGKAQGPEQATRAEEGALCRRRRLGPRRPRLEPRTVATSGVQQADAW